MTRKYTYQLVVTNIHIHSLYTKKSVSDSNDIFVHVPVKIVV